MPFFPKGEDWAFDKNLSPDRIDCFASKGPPKELPFMPPPSLIQLGGSVERLR